MSDDSLPQPSQPISGDKNLTSEGQADGGGNLGEEKHPKKSSDGLPNWPLWSIFIAIGMWLGILLVGQAAFGVVIALISGQWPTGKTPSFIIGSLAIQDIGFILAAVFACAFTGGRVTLQQFGFKLVPFWRSAGWMLLVSVIFGAVSYGWATLVDIPKDTLVTKLGGDQSDVYLVLVMVLVIVLAPITEEFFFRGFMFTALRRSIGVLPAAIIVGVVFGLLHWSNGSWVILPMLAVLGFLFCLLYVWSKSLIPCIVLHAINNALAFSEYEGWKEEAVYLVIGTCLLMLAITVPMARSKIGFEFKSRSQAHLHS